MSSSGIVIEQLFTDIPNLALQPTPNHSASKNKDNQPRKKQTSRKSTIESTAEKNGSMLIKLETRSPSVNQGRRKLSSLSSESKKQLTSEGPKFPITWEVALGLYSDQLTPFERTEITNYSNIYFMGLNCKKIQVANASEVDLYDDDESFYRATPHDHIAFRYEIAEKPTLGTGTFGQVLKAFDHKEKQMVALKLVRNDRTYLKQSRDELRLLQVLRKQDRDGVYNVIRLNEFFMFRHHMCISFELLGVNLYQVLRKNQYRGLGTTKIMMITRCVLKCLELLYKNRIIHCDIKPENIMLKRNDDFSSIKVGDFGSSCYEQQQVYSYIQSRFYRAPEVILGMRYGPAIDMWSLGCVIGELSSGYPIFAGKDEGDQLAAIEEVLGKIPSNLISKAKYKDSGRSRASGRGLPGTKGFNSVVYGDDIFKHFVSQMLQMDPHLRPSPIEIANHKWIKTKATPRAISSSSKTSI